MYEIARMWFAMGDDLLTSCRLDTAREMIERDHPVVDRRSVIGQLSPCAFGEGTAGPRTAEVIESRLQYPSAG